MIKLSIHVMSQVTLQRLAAVPFDEGTFVVSIVDTDAQPVRLINAPAGIVRLSFDDIYPVGHPLFEMYGDYEDDAYAVLSETFSPMSEKQAARVAQFVMENLPRMRTLVCQCHYGQSRSAGVAAAVSEWLYGNGSRFFNDERYCPNQHVYQLVLSALQHIDTQTPEDGDVV